MDSFLAITEHFAGRRALPERCLNRRHVRAGCRLCVDACPTGAITLTEGRPAVDKGTCLDCGLCLWRCPTGAFEQSSPPAEKLAATRARVDGAAVGFVCPENKSDGVRAAGAQMVRWPHCLASLSPSMLLAAVGAEGRVVWLDDSPCSACRLGSARQQLHFALEQARAWLSAYERPGDVRAYSDGEGELLPTPVKTTVLAAGRAETVDRRGFFGFLGGMVREAAAVAVTERLGPPPTPGSKLPQWLPPERQRLQQEVAGWEPAPVKAVATKPLGLAAIEVRAARCIACGWCARTCPSGALRPEVEGDLFRLLFNPLACLDCDICRLMCPTQAISSRPDVPVPAISAQVPLVSLQVRTCAECGTLTAAQAGELCFWCAAAARRKSW